MIEVPFALRWRCLLLFCHPPGDGPQMPMTAQHDWEDTHTRICMVLFGVVGCGFSWMGAVLNKKKERKYSEIHLS